MPPGSAEEIVRERYPDAVAKHHKAVHQTGQSAPIQPESWDIYPADGLGHQPIGTGPSAAAAWVAASTKVLEGLRKPKGLRIKREHLSDAGRVGAGSLPVEEIEATLDRGEEVVVEEADGSEALLERGEGGEYTTKAR